MILLAIDTSTASGSVSVRGRDGRVRQELLVEGRPASEALLPAVERLLAGAGIARGDVQGLAVGNGPGTFTGLRVGLATAKGWAAAASLQVVGVSSLEALALPVNRRGRAALVAADAGKGEVYAAVFGSLTERGTPLRKGEVVIASPQRAAAHLSALCPSGGILVGTASEAVRPFLPESLAETGPHDPYPRAWAVLEIGEERLASGEGCGHDRLVPFYVRPPDAVLPAGAGPPPKSEDQ